MKRAPNVIPFPVERIRHQEPLRESVEEILARARREAHREMLSLLIHLALVALPFVLFFGWLLALAERRTP